MTTGRISKLVSLYFYLNVYHVTKMKISNKKHLKENKVTNKTYMETTHTVWKTTVYIYNKLFQTPNKPGALRRINNDD